MFKTAYIPPKAYADANIMVMFIHGRRENLFLHCNTGYLKD